MMKRFFFFITLLGLTNILLGQVNPTRNLIVMIPDGTSLSVYSAARWFKFYNNEREGLEIDPYISGTVTTFSSNAPIGDSAPTGSAYATGVLQQTGNVAIYPEESENDIFHVDATRSLQPAATILEAIKIEKNKAVGLVVTCEFPHATPADFSAHHYKRSNYKAIASQMAHQNLDVMFGGGNGILTSDIKQHFSSNGTTLIQDDKKAFLDYNGAGKVWALFGEKALPYNLDRNPDMVPSISEMTGKALEILSKNENGFFLMVEGSQVDWAAHANDAVTMIDEYLAFDEAVGIAMDFAKKDGNTAVVVLSDHGNSGFSIGRKDCGGYDRLSIEQLFGAISKYKLSSNGLEAMLIDAKPEEIKSIFKEYTDIDISDDELMTILSSKNYKEYDYTKVGTSNNLAHNIVNILNAHTCFGFTTGGHTGEEVLMAAFHPQDNVPRGNLLNIELNHYLQQVAGLDTTLQDLSDKIFVKHDSVFSGLTYTIDKKDADFPVLVVIKGKKRLEIPAYSSVAKINGKQFNIGSVVVYIDKNDTFYLPESLLNVF